MGFVRAKGPDGAEFTVGERAAASMGDEITVLDKDPIDANGRPLPWKPVTDKAGEPVTAAAVRSSRRKKQRDAGPPAGEQAPDNSTEPEPPASQTANEEARA